jgi:hypothetical protein
MKINKGDLFENQNAHGRLIFVEPDEKTRYVFTIWFDYTRQLMTKLKEGDILAVSNFATDSKTTHWSLLELNSVLPIHYALGSRPEDLKGFPGYIMAAAGNLPTDWMQQESIASEDTTKINCMASPLGLEIVQNSFNSDVELQEEESLPMVGSEVRLLTIDSTYRILNKNLIDNQDTIKVGTLVREPSIDVLMDRENSIKTHIGVFGFTGVGKSNFLSSLINSIYKPESVCKIVIFDLNNEYLGLSPDLLLSENINGIILNIGEKTLNGKLQEYIKINNNNVKDITIEVTLKEILLSRSLNGIRAQYHKVVEKLIERNKFKLLRDVYTQTLDEFIDLAKAKVLNDEWISPQISAYLELLFETLVRQNSDKLGVKIDKNFAENLLDSIDNSCEEIDNSADAPKKSSDSALKNRINIVKLELKKYTNPIPWAYKDKNTMNFNDVIKELNNNDKNSLIIVNSFSADQMREFAYDLGIRLYETRRRGGLISPVTTFVFDEADEFIPSIVQAGSSQSSSKRVVEMIARRGRKFGIGLVISTQRATYLDTNIMGQLHTYFVSRLPRESDRERVSEAFSVSDEMFAQTFKFKKGDWLFISHESAGLDSVPIPIHSPNAEERIKGWLRNLERTGSESP